MPTVDFVNLYYDVLRKQATKRSLTRRAVAVGAFEPEDGTSTGSACPSIDTFPMVSRSTVLVTIYFRASSEIFLTYRARVVRSDRRHFDQAGEVVIMSRARLSFGMII